MRQPTRQRNSYWAMAMMGVVGLGSLACVSETTGNLGELSFYYTADDDVGNFNKPIAKGAKLEVFVRDAGDGNDRTVTLKSAETDDESIATINSFASNSMIVEGKGEGSFKISVTAAVDRTDEEESDEVNMLVRVPEVLQLAHTCREAGDRRGYYLTDHDISISFDMKLKDGQDVIGYGYYPVELDNAELLTFKEGQKGQQFIDYSTGSATGDVTLSSTIDDSNLIVQIVEEGAIDGLELAEDESDLRTGQTNLRFVLPTINNEEVCQSRATMEVSTTTPDICDVKPSAQANPGEDTEITALRGYVGTGWLEIANKAEGECSFDVTYPNAAGGEGVTESFTLTVKD